MTPYEEYLAVKERLRELERSSCARCNHTMTRHRPGSCGGLSFYETRTAVPCECPGFVREDEQLDLIREIVPDGRFGGVL